MTQVFADGAVVYDSRLDDYRVLGLKTHPVLNKGGTAEIVLPPNHPKYNDFDSFKTLVTIYRDGKLKFRGRALYPTDDFLNRRKITCEGEKCFLRDAIMRPYLYQDSPANIFTAAITEYNSQVDSWKQFVVGTITVTDANDYIRMESDTAKTMLDFGDALIDRCGGYIVFTTNAAGARVINWYASLSYRSSQTIRFGENLLDFTRSDANTSLATRIIPYGAKLDDGSRLTIKSVNGGLDYIQDDEAVALRGIIATSVTWDDVTVAANLLTKARQYLATSKLMITSLQLSAADLSLMDKTVDSFEVGDNIQVISKPHSVNDWFLLTEKNEDLLDPAQGSISLGKDKASLAGSDVAGEKKSASNLEKTVRAVKADFQVGIAVVQSAATAAQSTAANAQSTADNAMTSATANATDLANYVTSNAAAIADIQSQIDGSITTWFYPVAPTGSNKPASDWTTTDLKNTHLGDLYYDTTTGYCYRWQVASQVYSWARISDVDVTKALADAAAAQDTADSKRRVFVNTPTPPYDVGDLWAQGSGGDVLRCSTAKTSAQSYVATDWVKASKYTDDTTANTAKTLANAAQATADGKITTYYQTAAPASAHAGDLWIDTDDGNSLHRWSGSAWVAVSDAKLQQALNNAADAQATADGKIVTFAQTSAPTATSVGDLWIDTSDSNKLYRWDGSTWAAVRDNSIDSAIQQTTRTLQSLIQQTSESIMSEVSAQYATQGDVKSLISTKITQLSDSVNLLFTQLQATVDSNDADARTQFQTISKYIRFDNGDIILGEEGNTITLREQNDRLSFLDGGAEVAYFGNKKLVVLDGNFLNSLQIGSFAFIPRQNGNLSLIKVDN